jgi:hypothetical protein
VVNNQAIAALVDSIPADTWEVLREIKQRRPAIMLSELIDFRKRAPQQPEPSENRIASGGLGCGLRDADNRRPSGAIDQGSIS